MQRCPEGACPRGAHGPEYREVFQSRKDVLPRDQRGSERHGESHDERIPMAAEPSGSLNWRYVTRLESYPNGNKRKRCGFAANCVAPRSDVFPRKGSSSFRHFPTLFVRIVTSTRNKCKEHLSFLAGNWGCPVWVESRPGASTDAETPPRFPAPLIKPDVPVSSIRLSD
jgi:hypothetical protein